MAPSELVAACRLYAAACSAAAHELTDPDRKKILLDRIEACLTLADQIEKNRASPRRGGDQDRIATAHPTKKPAPRRQAIK